MNTLSTIRQTSQAFTRTLIIAAITGTIAASALAEEGACDLSVDVDLVTGGGHVTVEWGGIWPNTCAPSHSGGIGSPPQPSVEGNTIILPAFYECDKEYCEPEPTPYCLNWQIAVVSGTYEVVVQLSSFVCDMLTIPLGTVLVDGSPRKGPIAIDFNDGSVTGWSGPGDYEVIDGELHVNGDITWLDSTMQGSDLYADGTVRVTVRFLDEPTSGLGTPAGIQYTAFHCFSWGPCCFTLLRMINHVMDHPYPGEATIDAHVAEWMSCNSSHAQVFPEVHVGTPYRLETYAGLAPHTTMKFWIPGQIIPDTPQLSGWDVTTGMIALHSHDLVAFDDFVFTPAGWELLDDFIGTGLADWTTVDLTQSQSATFDFDAGRLILGSIEPASNTDGAGIAYGASMADPEAYANGTIRMIVRAQDSNADIIARASAELDDWYILSLNPIDGVLSLSRQNDGIETVLTTAQTDFANGEDWYLEFTFVGDVLSARAWPIHGEHLAEPLLSITDTSLTQGGIGIGTDGPSNIKRPVPLNLEVANVWFQAIEPTLTGDLNGDGVVNVLDLLILLEQWGTCAEPADCPADLNGDGEVNVLDLLILLGNWG